MAEDELGYEDRLKEVYRTLEKARSEKCDYYSIPYGCTTPGCYELDAVAGEYIDEHSVSNSCMESFPGQWGSIVWK